MVAMKIPLTQGKEATIDSEDWDTVRPYSWRAAKYVRKNGDLWYAQTIVRKHGKRLTLRMHRLILNAPPEQMIDHKDRDGLNNQKENLRFATPQQNSLNSQRARGKTGFLGVYKVGNKYRVQVKVGKKNRTCGYYDTPWDAAVARDMFAKKLQDEFRTLNFPFVYNDPQ